MGNQQHRNQNISEGEIYIELPSTTCVGGEYTQGIVHLDVRKIFHTDGLYLRFKGFERYYNGGVPIPMKAAPQIPF